MDATQIMYVMHCLDDGMEQGREAETRTPCSSMMPPAPGAPGTAGWMGR
jgi:hypothetical protein